MYTLDELRSNELGSVSVEINGKWVIARPLPFFGWWGFKQRVKNAYAVLTGKADAFKWPEGQ